MHRKHGIDRGTEVTGAWGGYPGEVWGALSSGNVTMYFQHNCTAPDFRDLVRRLSSRHVGLFNCSQPPDVLTVDSVGIAR